MKRNFFRYVGIVCIGLVSFVLLTVLAARVAASPSSVLNACVNPGNGMMRLVDASTACHANETFLEWNITGPQ